MSTAHLDIWEFDEEPEAGLVTLTLRRRAARTEPEDDVWQDITCALSRADLSLVEALDEDGRDVGVSEAEMNELRQRARAGEDETGR